MRFSSLKTKVLLWFASVIIVILTIFSFLLNHFIIESINLKIQNNLYYSAKDMHDEIMENKLEAITFSYEKQNGIDAAIIKEDYIIKQSNHFELDNYHHYTFKDDIFFLKESGFDTVDAIYVLNFTEPYSGSIVLTKKGLPNKAEEIEAILLLLNPLLFLIIFLVGIKFVDKILKPIKQLTEHTKQINIDNFEHLIDITNKEDEIQKLVLTYNAMILRLQEGVEKMDRFNNDVSHELRTPLTVINTQIDLALKKQRDYEYYKKSLQNISKESKKIEHLVKEMLLLTKYSKDTITSTFTLCDLNSLALESVEQLQTKANEKNINLDFDIFEKAILQANYSLIKVIFTNLIDNAIKYSPENSSITISLYNKENQTIFKIQDQGIGIPKTSLSKVTDRFYRVDESRNKHIKGFGLGLSLVKNSIDLHKGTLQIDSKISYGTAITISFPNIK